jgi:tetraacyldisaccharide 4'-kinase
MKLLSSARRLLFPLIPLYRLALAFRELRLLVGLEPVRRLRFPVVSIGNLSTGGAGKTPLTITLAKALKRRGLHVDALSRGYGRQSLLAARVRENGAAKEFGDEPLLIAREAKIPVYVAPRRYEAGLLAEADTEAQPPAPSASPAPESTSSGSPSAASQAATPLPLPHVHLLDDGFQHRQLDRDVEILLFSQQDWQDCLLPAGNLREPRAAIRRASVIALPANQPELEAALCAWGWQGPVWRLRRKMEVPLINSPVAAFCGIARPEQFFAGIVATGLEVAFQLAFPDHFTYTREVLEELLAKAREKECKAIVTTGKDLVRLGKLASIFPDSLPLVSARLCIEIEDESAALDWLVNRLAQHAAR